MTRTLLRWAVIGADDHSLALDVADLVASMSLLVDADLVAEVAVEVLDPERVAAAVPLVQPSVLAPGTRTAAKAKPEFLAEVRGALTRATGIDTYELAPLQRLTFGRFVGWVGTAVVVYLALAFASNWSSITSAFRSADFSYVPVILALTVAGTVGGALSLLGSVPRALPFIATVEVMYAQSFLNRFTPANAGGMALRARYLQTHGATVPAAAASVGITSAASGLLQVGR